jgi:hypothetical protein
MDQLVRAMDVCFHRPTNRRCLVVSTSDGTARCVADDDQFFDCPAADLVPYRDPGFSGLLRRAAEAKSGPPA